MSKLTNAILLKPFLYKWYLFTYKHKWWVQWECIHRTLPTTFDAIYYSFDLQRTI